MSYLIQARFRHSPLATVVESTIYPVYEIPFPAITVCNYNRLDWSRVDDVVELYAPIEFDYNFSYHELHSDTIQFLFLFFSSYLPRGNISQRSKLKTFLKLLNVFEFGSFENFTQLNLKEWSFDHISVYDIYRRVGETGNRKMEITRRNN